MEFTEVQNHDDFYSVDEGRVHVQDQRGYFVMYEEAIADLRSAVYSFIHTSTCLTVS